MPLLKHASQILYLSTMCMPTIWRSVVHGAVHCKYDIGLCSMYLHAFTALHFAQKNVRQDRLLIMTVDFEPYVGNEYNSVGYVLHNLIVIASQLVHLCMRLYATSPCVCVCPSVCVGAKCQSALPASQGTIFSMSSFVLSEKYWAISAL